MICISRLQRRLEGMIKNDGNICRMAQRHKISHPRSYNMSQLDQLYKITKVRKQTLKKQARFLRKEHLRGRRAKAVAQKDAQKARHLSHYAPRTKC
jgi:hypothetical protein